jgi:hypothetical protein
MTPAQLLRPELQPVLDGFTKWWARREKQLDVKNEVRRTIYHYTDMGGMVGIIANETFWFTSAFHLNDPSELRYGLSIADELLKNEFDRRGDAVKKFCHWVQHVLVKSVGEIFGFYIASFSQAKNDLAQWRAYADNARGVMLGLAPKLFRVLADQSQLGVTDKTIAAHVVYNKIVCTKNMRTAIRRAVAIVELAETSRLVRTDSERELLGRALANRLVVPIIIYAVTCKDAAYAHERETRLVITNQVSELAAVTKIRTRGSTLVPYIPSALAVRRRGAIREIMIGPAAAEMADDAVRTFLRTQGVPTSVLRKSNVPYTAR